MPSGRRHDSITLWTLPLVAGVTFERSRSSTLTLLVSGGFLLSGLMFGPDLDIYSRQYQRWGWLRWIWLPYRRQMRHRSFWSHGPVVGTVGRILYVLAWLGLVGLVAALGGAIASYFLGRLPDWHQMVQYWVGLGSEWLGRSFQRDAHNWLAGLLGLELGAMSHSLCDWLGSAYYRLRRPRGVMMRSAPARTPAARPAQSTQRSPQQSAQRSMNRLANRAKSRSTSRPTIVVPTIEVSSHPVAGPTAGTREPQLPAFGRWLRR